MIRVHNTLKTNTLILTWQSNVNKNSRFSVGTIKKLSEDQFEFSYNVNSEQFSDAIQEGFQGYPAFKISDGTYSNGVMSTFMKRIPPRSRKDFKKYLANHHLPNDFHGSDYELISHTGIQLPSDGFDVIPELSQATIPFDYMMEVAGTRYCISYHDFEKLRIGSEITFEREPSNEWDCNATGMYCEGKKIGYLNRLLCMSMIDLLESKTVECVLAKKSGTVERPLIFALIKVR